MDKIDGVIENLLKIPIYDLTTGAFMQIQEMKELASQYKDTQDDEVYKVFMDKYTSFSLKNNSKKQEQNISIHSLYKKIQTLEKINSELQSKMSSITFDNIYLINDVHKPTFGNILVYNKNQTDFWIIPHSMIDYTIVSTFTTSNQIAGWYFSSKGWQSLLLNDNKLHISVKVDEGKKLDNNNSFSILETKLWKVLIQKNNFIIPIFSLIHEYHSFLGDFNNVHRLLLCVSESKTFYVEKLQHTLSNLLQWNFTHYDFVILNDIINMNFKVLHTIKQEELLQPLYTASVMINPHSEDIINFNLLLNSLKSLMNRKTLPKLNLFTKTSKIQLLSHYSIQLKDNEEFSKCVSDDTIFEEQYLIFSRLADCASLINEIKNILTLFPKREQPRKIDMWIEFIRYLFNDTFTYLKYYNNLQIGKQIETDNILNTMVDCIEHIKIKGTVNANAVLPLPKSANSSNYEVWKNVIVKNIIPAYQRKIDLIFDYLIRGNNKNLLLFFKNHKLMDLVDDIVVNLYDTLDWGVLINQISNLLAYLHIPIQASVYDEFISLLEEKEMKNNFFNEFLTQFTTNVHVKEVIYSINFSDLCGFGIHQILTKKRILHPLNLTLDSNGIYWTETGLKIETPYLQVTKLISPKVDITETGLVCGYISFTCNKVSFNSTSNIYITNAYDFSRIPSEFHYIYCIHKKAIYMDSIVYNRLLENSKKYIKILGLCSLDHNSRKYKIEVSCFEPDKEICIEEDLILHTIDGLPFKYNNQMENLITMQEEMYHSDSLAKTFWKKN